MRSTGGRVSGGRWKHKVNCFRRHEACTRRVWCARPPVAVTGPAPYAELDQPPPPFSPQFPNRAGKAHIRFWAISGIGEYLLAAGMAQSPPAPAESNIPKNSQNHVKNI